MTEIFVLDSEKCRLVIEAIQNADADHPQRYGYRTSQIVAWARNGVTRQFVDNMAKQGMIKKVRKLRGRNYYRLN